MGFIIFMYRNLIFDLNANCRTKKTKTKKENSNGVRQNTCSARTETKIEKCHKSSNECICSEEKRKAFKLSLRDVHTTACFFSVFSSPYCSSRNRIKDKSHFQIIKKRKYVKGKESLSITFHL
jgi:hypothetical protein